jgi:hypothetical protein
VSMRANNKLARTIPEAQPKIPPDTQNSTGRYWIPVQHLAFKFAGRRSAN